MRMKIMSAAITVAIVFAFGGAALGATTATAATVRPTSGQTGYTYCWVLYPDLPNLDPYDARTWPANATCSPGQSTEILSKTVAVSTNTTTGQFISNTWTKNNAGVVVTGDPVIASGKSMSPSEANLSAVPGEVISVAITVALSFPAQDLKPIIDLNGVSQPRSISTNSIEMRTGSAPSAIDPSTAANDDNPALSTIRSCVDSNLSDVTGQTITIQCSSDTTIPGDFSFNQWNAGKGQFVGVSTYYAPEIRYVYPGMGGAGPWRPVNVSAQTFFRIDPANAWLPTALNKAFRIKADDTLTVTPSGLLAGAGWNQGDVGALETHITNVPKGGTVTPSGDLEFTSTQVGNYGFNYFVEDPDSGLRSQDATGAIVVYTDAVTPPAPPTVIDPPAAAPAHPPVVSG